jgi:hypothetical protein
MTSLSTSSARGISSLRGTEEHLQTEVALRTGVVGVGEVQAGGGDVVERIAAPVE